MLSLLTKHIQQELLVYQFQIKESGKLLTLLCICFSCFDVSPSAPWKALVVLTDQFECYLLVEKQGSDCSKHITLVITSCYVLMISSYVELTGHKTKSLKKKNQLTTIKPPGKDWFWTASCWVSTYIGPESGVNGAFSKSIGLKWTEFPISCANAFMADQWLFPTARVQQQQQQNTHYSYTHDLCTPDTHELRIHIIHIHTTAVTLSCQIIWRTYILFL